MSNQSDFINLIEESYILNKIKPYILKISETKIQNIKYVSLFIMSLIATSLLGTMVFFLFNFLTFYSSLRCILWLFECYTPVVIPINMQVNKIFDISNKRYIVETSAQDIIEYCIVPIFLRFIIIPLTYIPLPLIEPIIYFLCIMISLITITNKHYRQKLCTVIKYMFVDKNYVYGKDKERELHKLIQIFVYSLDRINSYLVNMINNPRLMINKLNDVKSIDNAFHILTTCYTTTVNNIQLPNINLDELSDGQLDDDYD